MSQIEVLRQILYQVIKTQDWDSIIKISRELDTLIVNYMETSSEKLPA